MGWYTSNILEVTGEENDLLKFDKSFRTNSSPSSKRIRFDKLYPVPEELLGDKERLYEWCDENWGTYHGECECNEIIIQKNNITYTFETKWEPPFSWIDYVSKVFSDLEFHLEYDELVETSRGQQITVRCTEEWNSDV